VGDAEMLMIGVGVGVGFGVAVGVSAATTDQASTSAILDHWSTLRVTTILIFDAALALNVIERFTRLFPLMLATVVHAPSHVCTSKSTSPNFEKTILSVGSTGLW
jgi:hypothetical protein